MDFSHLIEPRRVSVMFAGKPPEPVRAMLKANGFHWSPTGGFWWRPRVEGFAAFLMGLDRKLNPGRPDGACWKCNSPAGFSRPMCAATPVYCDACYSTLKEGQPCQLWNTRCRTASVTTWKTLLRNLRPTAPRGRQGD